MPKYRKKPVVIEAIQFTGKNKIEVISFVYPGLSEEQLEVIRKMDSLPIIDTPLGTKTVVLGDYVAKSDNGSCYLWKQDAFEAAHEKETTRSGEAIIIVRDNNKTLDINVDFNPALEKDNSNATPAQNAAMWMVNQVREKCEDNDGTQQS